MQDGGGGWEMLRHAEVGQELQVVLFTAIGQTRRLINYWL